MAIIKFIDKSGNISQLETLTDNNRTSKLEKIGNTYFEKKVEVKTETKKVEKIIVPELREEVIENTESSEDLEAKAKDFCRENKVRGYGLLKGEKLIAKAKENGFIC
jgi:hypothetical protein